MNSAPSSYACYEPAWRNPEFWSSNLPVGLFVILILLVLLIWVFVRGIRTGRNQVAQVGCGTVIALGILLVLVVIQLPGCL